jgi:hypothetical protein
MRLVSLACIASAQIAATVALPGQGNDVSLESRSPGIKQRQATQRRVTQQINADNARRAAAQRAIDSALAAGQAAARAAVSGGGPR